MKLKEKLAREFSGSDAFIPDARLTNNKLNRDLTKIEKAFLAGFEKARELIIREDRVSDQKVFDDEWIELTAGMIRKVGEDIVAG